MRLTLSIPPSLPCTAALNPLFLISLPTAFVSNSRTTLEVERLLEAAEAADGLVKFLVDCLGRVAAARLNAGKRRNMLYEI